MPLNPLDAAIERFAQVEQPERRLRIGVAELVTMTWLPRFVAAVHARFPRTSLEPDVDDSLSLRSELLLDELDIAILRDLIEDCRSPNHSWQGAQYLDGQTRPAWTQPSQWHDIAVQRLLTRGGRSATGSVHEKWFRDAGVSSTNRIVSNSPMPIVGMSALGLGVAHLPQACLQSMLDLGMLEGLQVLPPVPDAGFVVARKADRHSTVIHMLVETAREPCDFGQAFRASEQPS